MNNFITHCTGSLNNCYLYPILFSDALFCYFLLFLFHFLMTVSFIFVLLSVHWRYDVYFNIASTLGKCVYESNYT